jgi:hypothetical protein
MTEQEMINEWLKKNKPKTDTTVPLNRDTLSIDFRGNLRRKQTARKTALSAKVLS